jgi:hypothetical protein
MPMQVRDEFLAEKIALSTTQRPFLTESDVRLFRRVEVATIGNVRRDQIALLFLGEGSSRVVRLLKISLTRQPTDR